jgi:putative glutamine amidotransferase
MVLGLKYLKAIERAGGMPVVVPPLQSEAIDSFLDRVDGLCLSGGPDLHPAAYEEKAHALLGPTWSELDAFELALVRAADERKLPILAICRGLQVLNVSRGGTLHQHLPDVVGTTVVHRQPEPGNRVTHSVEVDGASQLAMVMGCCRAEVNSFHHQAVCALGRDLVDTSHAADGTIESLEAQDRDFVLGVQWHAENLIDRPAQQALFEAFVAAAHENRATALMLRAA